MRTDKANEFMECPICNKRPKIVLKDINYARAYCKGSLFHRHKNIDSGWTGFCSPGQLYEILKQKWEDAIYTYERKRLDEYKSRSVENN